jgi:hypothetical protein
MEVDTATQEEAESLVYAMLLSVLTDHIRIISNFVDVTENLMNEKMERNIKMVHCESALVEGKKNHQYFK